LQEIGSANDTSYIFEGNNSTFLSTAYLSLEDLPADFDTMDTLSVQYRRWADTVSANKTLNGVWIQVLQSDRSTALTNIKVESFSGGLSDTTPTNSSVLTMTGVNTTAAKSVWDAAVVAITFSVTRSMGGNQDEYRVSAFELTGTYTLKTPTAPTSRTLSAADPASSGGEVDLSWNEDTAAYPNPTYTIEKSTDGTNFTTHATGVTNPTSYTVTGLTNNQLYYFRITGTNASGSAVSNTASATPTAFSRENTLEGGTDEDAINANASDSGPDAFDLFYSNTAAVYDTARAKGGTVSMRTEHSGTTGSSMAGWTFTSNTQSGPGVGSSLYTRFYFYATSAPSADVTIVRYGDSSDSVNAYIDFLSTGVFKLSVSGSGSATLSTSTSLNTWVRVEARLGSVNSTIRLFNTTESTTATESVNDGYIQSAVGTVRFGVNATTAGGPFWWDSLALSAEDWIGPESTASTSFQGKLGDLTVSKLYLGDTEVTGGYLGDIDLWA
jgi:hypothetical protein